MQSQFKDELIALERQYVLHDDEVAEMDLWDQLFGEERPAAAQPSTGPLPLQSLRLPLQSL